MSDRAADHEREVRRAAAAAILSLAADLRADPGTRSAASLENRARDLLDGTRKPDQLELATIRAREARAQANDTSTTTINDQLNAWEDVL